MTNDDGSSLELLDSRGGRDYETGLYQGIIGVRNDSDDCVRLIEANARGGISYSELSFDCTSGRAERRLTRLDEMDLRVLEPPYGADLDGDSNTGAAVVVGLDNATDPAIAQGQREVGTGNGNVSLFSMTSGAWVLADAGVRPGSLTAVSSSTTRGEPSVEKLDGGGLDLGIGKNTVTSNGSVSTQQGAWDGELKSLDSATDSFVLEASASGDAKSNDVKVVELYEYSTASVGASDESVRLDTYRKPADRAAAFIVSPTARLRPSASTLASARSASRQSSRSVAASAQWVGAWPQADMSATTTEG